MPLALNNNRGSVYSRRMKIEVPERWCLTDRVRCILQDMGYETPAVMV